jgi:homoserine O-succinyltransferase
MPLKIPNDLPAYSVLQQEGVMLISESDAIRQDIRPLKIALLNLMPNKIKTETQFARLCGATPLQVEMTLIKMTNHTSRNTPEEHLLNFYENFQDVKNQKFDGLIITGAPIEHLEFEDVDYYSELKEVFNWTQTHVHSTFAICWGAQAALHHLYGTKKYTLQEKAFGVFSQENLKPSSPYLRGFSDEFSIPVARWTEIREEELPKDKNLETLIRSELTGPCLINDPDHRMLYMFNHLEYDSESLGEEYFRDLESPIKAAMPQNYFPENETTKKPKNLWRSHAHLLFGNWINEVYQTTPFEIGEIPTGRR